MRRFKGSVTVEAAFLVPFILLIISVTITLLFFYHDKVVMRAVLHETLAVMSKEEEVTEKMAESYFQEQSRGRLLLFPYVSLETEVKRDEVHMKCHSARRGMQIYLEARMKRSNPETWVRTINNIIGE